MASSRKSSSRKSNKSKAEKEAVEDAKVTDAVEAEAGSDGELADANQAKADDAAPTEDAVEVEDTQAELKTADQASEAIEAEDAVADETENAAADEPPVELASETSEPPQAAAPARESSSFMPMVLGGVIAAVLGFGAAMILFPDGVNGGKATEVLESKISQQGARIEALAAELGEADGGLQQAINDLETGQATTLASISDVTGKVDALSARLEALTSSEGGPALPADVQILLNAQKEQLDALRGEVEDITAIARAQAEAAAATQESAEQAEARAKARAALSAVRLALTSGAPYADSLPALAGAGDVPEGLAASAENGAPTTAEIEDGFPPAARRALQLSIRETAGDDNSGLLRSFLQDQLGARSLTPREGDDPDAVLSRAEAAVKAGDLPGAFAELDALPEVGQAEFADWRAQAEARLAAQNGFEAVADSLNSN